MKVIELTKDNFDAEVEMCIRDRSFSCRNVYTAAHDDRSSRAITKSFFVVRPNALSIGFVVCDEFVPMRPDNEHISVNNHTRRRRICPCIFLLPDDFSVI